MTLKNVNPLAAGAVLGFVVLIVLTAIRLSFPATTSPAPTGVVNAAESDALRCEIIYDEYHARSTDLQRFQYIEELKSKPFVCTGTVNNVTSDGIVYVSVAGTSPLSTDMLILHDVPAPDLARLNAGNRINFAATVNRRAGALGLMLDADFMSWYAN